MYSCSLCLPRRLLPQIVISHISQSDFNNPLRRGMNLFYPAVCVSCRWRESGSNSKEQRARVSGPLRLLSVEKLASLPLCDCWTSVQHGESRKKPLIFYSEGKQTLTFNAVVLDIWIFCVRNVLKSALEVCRHGVMSMFALLPAEYKTKQQNEPRNRGLCIEFCKCGHFCKSHTLERTKRNCCYRYTGLTKNPIL